MPVPPMTYRFHFLYAPGTGNTVTSVPWTVYQTGTSTVIDSGSIASPVAGGGADSIVITGLIPGQAFDLEVTVNDSGGKSKTSKTTNWAFDCAEYVYALDLGKVPEELDVETLDSYVGGQQAWYAKTGYWYAPSPDGTEANAHDWTQDPTSIVWGTDTWLMVLCRTAQGYQGDASGWGTVGWGITDGVDRVIARYL